MLQAHTNAMARDLAGGLAFGEVHELSTKMAATIPPEQIDRMLSGKEAAHMIVRLVEGRGRPEEMTGRFPRPWRMVEHAASFIVQDATGRDFAWFHFQDGATVAPLLKQGECQLFCAVPVPLVQTSKVTPVM